MRARVVKVWANIFLVRTVAHLLQVRQHFLLVPAHIYLQGNFLLCVDNYHRYMVNINNKAKDRFYV